MISAETGKGANERSRAHMRARRVDASLAERATRRVLYSWTSMPAFVDLLGTKRKAPGDDGFGSDAAKRRAVDNGGGGSGGSWDSYWMVQWYASVALIVSRG
jgi:hypothetical protein